MALIACLTTSCTGDPAPPAERVILITCDTLRRDRLGVYGGASDTTPRLDAFATEATVFETAFASAPLTSPAIGSLLTGRRPDELGMGTNKVLMPSEATTVAEVIKSAGLPTAAIVSNWVLRKRAGYEGAGVDQGFAYYDDRMQDAEVARESVMERVAAKTTGAALAWLRERPSDRFFLWVHYQDPHGPYTPPAEYVTWDESRDGTDETPLPLGETQKGLRELPGYQALGDERRPAFYRSQYDAEIRYFDHELGRLLDGIEDEGLSGDALIIFTADHGESMGEHNWWFSHGQTLFRELVHVPLIVRFPAGARSPTGWTIDGVRRVDELVGHVDLAATILEALGLDALPTHGTSLLTERLSEERVLVQSLRLPDSPGRWEGLTDGRWRIVTHPRGELLFDLLRDPDESENRRTSDAAEVDRIRALHAETRRTLPPLAAGGTEETLDAEGREAMKALGYAGEDE